MAEPRTRRDQVVTSGMENLTMSIIDITTLRPKGTAAKDLNDALTRATAAQGEQANEVRRLQQARDALLLDGTPAAMAKADADLLAGRGMSEKIASVVEQLGSRLAAAEEAETVARVTSLRAEAEATDEVLSAWWIKMRKKLASELTAGVQLHQAAGAARQAFDQAARATTERYPTHSFPAPARAAVDAGFWMDDLRSSASAADMFPDSFNTLLTAGDPKPPGTF